MTQRVRIIKNLPGLKLVRRELGPAAEGQEIDVESWEVPVLERHGFAEPVQRITVAELRKRVLAEEKASALETLPQDFYAGVANRAEGLRKNGQVEQLRELREAASSLVEMRTQKLVRLAASEAEARGLPPEEQFLLNRLTAALDNWREWLDHLLEEEIKEEAGEHGGKFGEPV